MKRLLISALALTFFFASCSKKDKNDDTLSDNSVQVTINGEKLNFSVESATLIRVEEFDAKRLDISCVSADKQHRVILTVGNYVLEGNNIDVKTYDIAMFTQDDPSTPDIDESENDTDDGLFTYSKKLGENNWQTGIHTVKGKIVVTANNATDKTISGTFEMDLKDIDTQASEIKFTEGKFNNVKYMVLN